MIIFIDIIVSKVTARLERQRKVWDEKLEQMKNKARTQREESTALMLSTATSSSLGNKVKNRSYSCYFDYDVPIPPTIVARSIEILTGLLPSQSLYLPFPFFLFISYSLFCAYFCLNWVKYHVLHRRCCTEMYCTAVLCCTELYCTVLYCCTVLYVNVVTYREWSL